MIKVKILNTWLRVINFPYIYKLAMGTHKSRLHSVEPYCGSEVYLSMTNYRKLVTGKENYRSLTPRDT